MTSRSRGPQMRSNLPQRTASEKTRYTRMGKTERNLSPELVLTNALDVCACIVVDLRANFKLKAEMT